MRDHARRLPAPWGPGSCTQRCARAQSCLGRTGGWSCRPPPHLPPPSSPPASGRLHNNSGQTTAGQQQRAVSHTTTVTQRVTNSPCGQATGPHPLCTHADKHANRDARAHTRTLTHTAWGGRWRRQLNKTTPYTTNSSSQPRPPPPNAHSKKAHHAHLGALQQLQNIHQGKGGGEDERAATLSPIQLPRK